MFLGLALQSPGSTLFEDRDDVAGPLANRRRFRLVCSPGREPLNLSCNSIRLGSGPAATDKVAVEASSNLLVVTKAHQERASVRRWLHAAERCNRSHHTRSTKVAADPFIDYVGPHGVQEPAAKRHLEDPRVEKPLADLVPQLGCSSD